MLMRFFFRERVLSEPFHKLPSRKKLPGYYTIIKKPVDIKKINAKINDGKVLSVLLVIQCSFTWILNPFFSLALFFQYVSIDELEYDFILLCKNAQKYNEEESLIYRDSVALEKVFHDARNDVENSS